VLEAPRSVTSTGPRCFSTSGCNHSSCPCATTSASWPCASSNSSALSNRIATDRGLWPDYSRTFAMGLAAYAPLVSPPRLASAGKLTVQDESPMSTGLRSLQSARSRRLPEGCTAVATRPPTPRDS
jgi:hypothetical protein